MHWSEGTWTHEPTAQVVDGDDLVVSAAEGSDAWRITSYGFIHDSEHALLAPFPPESAVEVEFTLALTEQFDVAPDEPWILHPGEFALGSTWEYVKLDATVAARLEGKSSLGRLGILTHSTAGFIDPGFEGHITLELSNVSTLPVKLWPGMKIGQMCFFQLSSPAEHPYGSKGTGSHYQGQRGPTPSRSYVNFYKADVND